MGIAKDVMVRFKEHASGRGAKYTRANPPEKIVYIEKHKDHSAAAKREAQIKKWSRAEKETLISGPSGTSKS